MKSLFNIILLACLWLVAGTGCKKPYAPPAIQADIKLLVIDGTLINSIDSPSVFTLSRTKKLTDTTFSSSPETGAKVSVEGSTGEIFDFTEQPNGIYKADHIILNPANKYRLKVSTGGGDQYLSDYVEVKQAPPIDSVTWQQQNDVTIYVNSHDPLNNTRYYKWDFIETWQYSTPLDAELSQNNGVIFYVDSTNQTHTCWNTSNSNEILVGTSVALSQDVISKAPIAIVTQNSEKISIRYSILVKQYALTEQAYQYLVVLKKNTENLGSIFDAQPTQLTGNIFCVNNPSQVAIGFFSASSVQQKRLFITKNEVTDWEYIYTGRECDILIIPGSPFSPYDYPDPEYAPYYFSGGTSLFITRKPCVDCRVEGGINKKPAFW